MRGLLALAWLALACNGAPLSAAPAASLEQQAQSAVVKILSREAGEGPQREGTGFVVGFEPGLTFLVTAAHVVVGDPRPRVIFAASPHQSYEATPVRLAADLDVAVLKVPGFVPGTVALPFDRRPVELTEAVEAVGYPDQILLPRWTTAAAAGNEDGGIVLDKPLAEGHSGGPLLRGGWVVGLVRATEAGYAHVLPAALVGQVLASWRVPVQMQTTEVRAQPVRREEPLEEARPAPLGNGGAGAVPPPPGSRCFGEVASSMGSGQPVRIRPQAGATAQWSLPAGTRVAVGPGYDGSGYRWYEVTFQAAGAPARGFMQADHLKLDAGCR